ncbi:choice-of-anchor M domain-containing protein [Luteolibacter flavescens]|uniref:Choice-of-anchor M domain-containing protein n=1 Tax=Luteolibacter flavescens TaxID=1859460 RepID=A0ABT3FPS5_9BACT|nr:choice-of-anchor M domain-containing protein [Luteolibacter flavescens]MCW1885581.1 choice-of-anchor M domain-containing protein [Luteolibacter flavescens]
MKTTIPTLAIAALLASPAHSALYTSGHADYGIGYENGDFHFHFHAEGATVDGIERDDEEFDIPDVITVVSSGAMLSLPIDFAPLGAQTGDIIWVLPEVENMTLPFLGLATEELSTSEWGDITFSLGAVTSPSGNGEFALWQSGSLGDLLLRMSTSDPSADALTLLPGSHAHYNYGFTEAGIWQIEMTVSGTHVTDGFKSATETLTFHVIPEPSVFLLGGLGLAGLVLRRRR